MIELIKDRLKTYGISNPLDEEHATKEVLQEIALYALWRLRFFDVGLFQGGTSLRILHGLPRFSEDLDFMLRRPDPDFDWSRYLEPMLGIFAEFGLQSEALPRGKMDARIRAAVIKDTSVAQQIDLGFADRDPRRKIKIKLEIDVEPPLYSGEDVTFLDFPLDHEVRHQDLASNFALKVHALLCRGFLKGRDWFDFSWYVARGVYPNLPHLEVALSQFGPWSEEEGLRVDPDWLLAALTEKIAEIEWSAAAEDVRRFLKPAQAASLDLWSKRFFLDKLRKLDANRPY
ncbi:nucleotidyl transferase AbiEii/AbiGii toxin family protein [Parvularcula maris]|uniref:Nucleotidyl transferase AbiEii/AbiGii toxin family protein n=1 Tax=Parvularcula maris TaxID=2965077 RepID=A0A9X2RIV8_9PROT|nr:nucleotidyl transferase AbiEii/AbiGii toxin family protein [Parvularcula maris]MCQ8186510.1 nucleotidyl transferase AbiEii/AbiGii toxin family protein [Parvularcula maris]